jgi:hypothetical protein
LIQNDQDDPILGIRRRDFIAAVGGAAAWPLAARAQQGERMRRIGLLSPLDENDPVAKRRLSAFTQALADLGWADDRNVRMDLRWGRGQPAFGVVASIAVFNGAIGDLGIALPPR